MSLPLDVLDSPAETVSARSQVPQAPGPAMQAIKAAAELFAAAKTPIILAGGGCQAASAEIKELAEKSGAMVVTTIAGKGILSSYHPLSLGSTLQQVATRRAIAAADLVLAVGTEIAEPDLYLTISTDDNGDGITPDRLDLSGKLIRIDLDPGVVVRDYAADVAIVSDASASLQAMIAAIAKPSLDQSREARHIRDLNEASSVQDRPAYTILLNALRAALPADGQVFADMCKLAYAGCMSFPTTMPRSWHFPNGYGTLGYALPAAIGGKIACPNRATVALIGDGGIMFTIAELATAVENKLPIVIILWDNEALAEIRDGMRARQMPEIAVHPLNPDFEGLIKSFDASYEAPENVDELEPVIARALMADGPTVVHVREKMVFG
jgi:5-guanidino-2-oxopentanoate decarboxylase